MNDIIPLKRCPKCDNDFPPILQYFYNDKSKKDGLTCYCKLCQSAKGGKKPSRKPKTDIKRHRSTSQEYKYCPKCQQEKPATLEYFYSHKGYGRYGLCSECKDCRALYRKAHFEELRTYHRQQELKNLDRNQARRKAYRESHAEENRRRIREYERAHTEKKRAYVERNREQIRAYHRNYRDTTLRRRLNLAGRAAITGVQGKRLLEALLPLLMFVVNISVKKASATGVMRNWRNGTSITLSRLPAMVLMDLRILLLRVPLAT